MYFSRNRYLQDAYIVGRNGNNTHDASWSSNNTKSFNSPCRKNNARTEGHCYSHKSRTDRQDFLDEFKYLTRSASASSFSAVRNRISQIAGLPARSANFRYHAASFRNSSASRSSMRSFIVKPHGYCVTFNDFFDLSSKMGQNAVLISSKMLYHRQKLKRRTRAIARFDLFRGCTFVGASFFL